MITALSLSPAVDKIYYIDNFNAGSLYRVDNVVKSAGGKGINVARVASILGEKVCCLGFKAGHSGEWLESELLKLGVDTRFITVEGESRTNSNVIDRIKGAETEILEIGPEIVDVDKEMFLDIFSEVVKNTKVLVCSGGLPKGVPVDFYRTLIGIASQSGVKVILDTSNEVLKEGVKARPYMIKPNKRELSRLVGKELSSIQDIIDACRFVNSLGVENVVASLGKDGALLVSKEQTVHIRPPQVEVVNTIGSGDSMVSGIAAGLYRNWSIYDAFLFGVACSVANTQFVEIGYVTLELVNRYLGQLEVIFYDVM